MFEAAAVKRRCRYAHVTAMSKFSDSVCAGMLEDLVPRIHEAKSSKNYGDFFITTSVASVIAGTLYAQCPGTES